jgi:hypothetical protein
MRQSFAVLSGTIQLLCLLNGLFGLSQTSLSVLLLRYRKHQGGFSWGRFCA